MVSLLHIISGLSTGGAEQALYNLLAGGLADRFKNYVISLCDEGTMGPRFQKLGIPVVALHVNTGKVPFGGLLKLLRLTKEISPVILQGWMYHGNLAATVTRQLSTGILGLAWNIRHSLYDLEHEKLVTRQVIRMNRLFSSGPEALLYNSRLSRKQHEVFGFAAQKGCVIPNGINLEKFSFSMESRENVRLELNIPLNAVVIGHVARLHPMKDHAIFLRAASTIARNYPEVHFLMSGRNITIENDMMAELIPLPSVTRFHLVGERNDVPDLMSAMDIFCLSSWSEGFPNVLGEAMATSRPCITTDAGDSALLLGDTGVVVPPRDEEALTAGIESLLLMSCRERSVLGRLARCRVEEHYPLEKIVEQYAAVYDKMLS